ncbi:MAG: Omp28 family outer membrane lipoprotein [Bacteroidota bacterium]
MKNISLAIAALITLVTIQSCDKVSPPYKSPIVVPAGERNVLVEDFTGHKCGFCPRATRAAYDLKQTYGDRMIVLSIHAGFFASTNIPPYTYDFKCAESVAIDTDFGISLAGNPNGMVNRKKINGSFIIPYTSWGAEVANVLNSTAPLPVRIGIEASYDSTSRKLDTDVQLDFAGDLQGTHKLSVYLVEDSIVKWQKDYDASPSDVENYVHREVLRGSLNGTYGDVIGNTTAGETVVRSYSTTLNANWDAKHMSLVVFLYNDATKEIIQVEQKHLE